MNLPDKPNIPCFLCGKLLRVKQTKNDKPYFICEPCGLQVFVRCKPGIKSLNRLISRLSSKSLDIAEILNCSFEVISLNSRLAALRSNLSKLEESEPFSGFFGKQPDNEPAKKAVRSQIRKIELELKQLAES